jgi:hypothetical protein
MLTLPSRRPELANWVNKESLGAEASPSSKLNLKSGARLRKKTRARTWEGASSPPPSRGSYREARESTKRAHRPSSSVAEHALPQRRAVPCSCAVTRMGGCLVHSNKNGRRVGNRVSSRERESARAWGEARTEKWGSGECGERRGEPPPWLAGVKPPLPTSTRARARPKDGGAESSIQTVCCVRAKDLPVLLACTWPFWHIHH